VGGLAACGQTSPPPKTAGDAVATLSSESFDLPGAPSPAAVDYVAYEPGRERIWIPVANTASVDVFDIATRTFSRVDGFASRQVDAGGTKRWLGPSAVSLGDGFAYVGDRASSEVCAVHESSLAVAGCVKLASGTDGVAYVAPTREVWVTTPKDHAIVVLDASKPEALAVKTTIRLGGSPEGYALDVARGAFFTNLEDADKTVVIDVKSREPKATWSLDCSSEGPRGIAVDAARGLVFVACTQRVLVLDGKSGAERAALDTGAGVDNIDWLEPRRLLYVAAGKNGALSVAHVDDQGQFALVAHGATGGAARNAVSDAKGNAYVVDRGTGRLLVFAYAR
jgi:DNA-binding beta-propeller fold protein YncE